MQTHEFLGLLRETGRRLDERFQLSARGQDVHRLYSALRSELRRARPAERRWADRSWIPEAYRWYPLRKAGAACRECQRTDPLHPAEKVAVADSFAGGTVKRCATCGAQWVEREVR